MIEAFIDESLREPGGQRPAGAVYILACAVVSGLRAGVIRRSLRGVLRPHQHRFHWHDEAAEGRRAMVDRLARCDFRSVAAVCPVPDPRRSERARRLCLSRLLWELRGLKLDRLVLESRSGHSDRMDQAILGWGRRAGLCPARLACDFGLPGEEPLLWIPDSIAGAIGQSLSGDRGFLLGLGGRAPIVHEVFP
ncbi:MAG TPA: hypothetical protein VIA06_03090 [Candidatus Dormibacteraeota bacterium]|jgi:hypothetical protein|nr:hypothetical protein [Candidatus Dormibacteraeota bacterium]